MVEEDPRVEQLHEEEDIVTTFNHSPKLAVKRMLEHRNNNVAAPSTEGTAPQPLVDRKKIRC